MSLTQATKGAGADQMISAAVRGLIAQRRVNVAQVAVAAGVSRAALYRKLNSGSPWYADEVEHLAHFFRVSRDSLYEGRAEFARPAPATVVGASSARSSTDRASDYGSEGRRARSPFRTPNERRRRMGAIPLHLHAVPNSTAA